MKKTKRVLSYMMMLVPLALPAGCSPVSSVGADSNAVGNGQQAGGADEAEQLRLIVERYFEQQERQRQSQRQVEASSPQIESENGQDVAGEPALIGSEDELKEEMDELQKTGAWTAENIDKGQTVQCQLPGTGVIEAPDRPEPPSVSGPLPQPAEPAAVSSDSSRTACDFPVLVNKQVQFYLNLFQNKQRKHFQHWLERSTMYLPQITAELKKAGLPLELAWLAMIESGFNPSAYSPAHASGLWQFIPSTAQNYGLRIDSWADERRDPEKSTKAAISYLKALYQRFGDWHLTVAAYNAGEGMVERGLRQYKVKNFWDLAQYDALRLETRRYVPQMIAAVLITRNPEQYGFRNVRYKRPAQHELVRVPPGTELKTVAASASVSVEQLRSLNNDLLKEQVPAEGKGWLLKVPAGRAALVAAKLAKAQTVAAADDGQAEYLSHKIAKNETLQEIGKKYGVTMTALLKVNNLSSSKLLAGQRLRIPTAAAPSSPGLVLTKNEAVSAPAEQSRITHKLNKGETLSEVAERYGVPLAELMRWNQISKAGKVRAGRQLTVYPAAQLAAAPASPIPAAAVAVSADKIVELTAVGKRRSGETAVQPAAASVKQEKGGGLVLLSGGKKQPSSSSSDLSYYKVRNGDSLWSISRKLQISAKDLKSWNSLNGSSLQVGATLVIRKG